MLNIEYTMDKFRTVFSRSLNKKDEERRSHQFMKRHSNPALRQHGKVPEWSLTLFEQSPLSFTNNTPWTKEPNHSEMDTENSKGIDCSSLEGSLMRRTSQQVAVDDHGIHDSVGIKAPPPLSVRQENNNTTSLMSDSDTSPLRQENINTVLLLGNKDTRQNGEQTHTFGGDTMNDNRYQQKEQEQPLTFLTNTHLISSPHCTPTFVSPTQPSSAMLDVSTTSFHLQSSWARPPYSSVNAITSLDTSHVPHAQLDRTHPLPTTDLSLQYHHHQQEQQCHVVAANSNHNRNIYTHSRSRSVPYVSHGTAPDFDNMATTRPTIQPSRSSMDLDSFHQLSLDQTKSLLLTQTFIPSTTHTPKSINPFEDETSDDGHQLLPSTTLQNPFEDHLNEDNGEVTTSTTMESTLTDLGRFAFLTWTRNRKPNHDNIPAPPVPPQSTKPPFPRYGRNRPLKRSQSQNVAKINPFISQGTFLLATSSTSSRVQFPSPSSDDPARLFRHKSIHSIPQT